MNGRSEEKPQLVQTGNARTDSTDTHGWFVGNFLEKSLGLRHSSDVELKWSVHKAGAVRKDWVTGETRTTIAILVSGKFEVIFRDQTSLLSKPGDYVIWGKGTDHRRRAVEDSTVLTVRWPSVPV